MNPTHPESTSSHQSREDPTESQAKRGEATKLTTPTLTSSSASKMSSNRLRSNLLHKLGIHAIDKTPVIPNSNRVPRPLLEQSAATSEPLKYIQDDDDESIHSNSSDSEMEETEDTRPSHAKKSWMMLHSFEKPSHILETMSSSVSSDTSSSISSQKTNGRRLKFNDNVTVVPIPMRDDYSHRIKERLWNNLEEIQMNAHRNAVEFAAEGWDWRTVTEDDEMYRCATSGELIHPVHLEPESFS